MFVIYLLFRSAILYPVGLAGYVLKCIRLLGQNNCLYE